MGNGEGVEAGRICSRCYARTAEEVERCPACSGAMAATTEGGVRTKAGQEAVVDRRGIILPARHAVGGVITPR